MCFAGAWVDSTYYRISFAKIIIKHPINATKIEVVDLKRLREAMWNTMNELAIL